MGCSGYMNLLVSQEKLKETQSSYDFHPLLVFYLFLSFVSWSEQDVFTVVLSREFS
jgi:hypothetical protein